jgi:hypothetical protein
MIGISFGNWCRSVDENWIKKRVYLFRRLWTPFVIKWHIYR